MTDYVWVEVREEAIRLFGGEVPSAGLEAVIIEVFEQSPARVVGEIPRVAHDLAAGKIKSGWAILKARSLQVAAGPNPVVSDTLERDRRVGWCERWMRTAGLHFDRESEILDELFGYAGKLKEWAQLEWFEGADGKLTGEYVLHGDELLAERMVLLWREERPRGVLAEAEMERVAAERVVLRRSLAKKATKVDEEVLPF